MLGKVKQTHHETKKMNERLQVTSDRQEYEIIWKVLYLAVTGVMVYLSGNIYQLHTSEEFKDHRKESFFKLLLYSIPFAVVHSLFDWYWHLKVDGWVDRNFIGSERYKDEISRRRRSFTIAKWAYSIIFYTMSSLSGFYLIKDTSFFPAELGGRGSIYTLSKLRYLEQATPGMEIYYILQLGKHLSRFFGHVFLRPEGNFYEYVLHHSLSTFLIIFSYCMNMWVIGIFVLALHDYTDMGLILARAYKDYRNRNQIILGVFYVHATCAWIFLRVFVFSYCCVYAVFYQCIYDVPTLLPAEQQIFGAPYWFMAFMLGCLQIMHIFWTYFIITSFVSVTVSDKIAKHSYD